MSDRPDLLASTTDIVAAMVSNNAVPADELAALITSTYTALSELGQEPSVEPEASKPEQAVTVRKSLADPNFIVSMIDGKPYSSLKLPPFGKRLYPGKLPRSVRPEGRLSDGCSRL